MKKKFKPVRKTGWITIFGAREHNLKNIDVSIPKEKLTVITGPSGSGKSSLALDILFTEGKRRYMESLSSYARQFLGIAKKPAFDRIDGLCPAIAIEQKTVNTNPRSTVGTITEIYDYFRILFARIGRVHCPGCAKVVNPASAENVTDLLLKNFEKKIITIAAPIANQKKGEFKQVLQSLIEAGFYRFNIDGVLHKFKSSQEIKNLKLKKTYKHTIDLLIDNLEVTVQERPRLQEAIESSFKHANGCCKVIIDKQEHLYSLKRICLTCNQSIPELEPRLFSFNSPFGACQRCQGLGMVHKWPWGKNDADAWRADYPQFFSNKYAKKYTCSSCQGKRLNKYALAVRVGNKNIYDLSNLSIQEALSFFKELNIEKYDYEIASGLIKEIVNRLTFLNNVGLSYLTLNRSASTLSGGEGQRIRLATQIGSALSGVLYILDEPSIGLHQRDNDRLIKTLKALRDQGNTVVVVEHDIDTMQQADYLVDMGPAAGLLGGKITAHGTPKELAVNAKSLTGAYLSGKRSISVPKNIRKPHSFMTLTQANKHNLKNITVQFPLGVLCGISGVSGSGKSTLVMQELVPAVQNMFAGNRKSSRRTYKNKKSNLNGAESLENMVAIDQSPIGRTPRSNPATYLGIFDEIRKLFALLPESNARGYLVGRFSFNVAEGRCFSCRGEGIVKIEMHFLPEVTITCKVCNGKRYDRETLQITYKNKTIADVLAMTVRQALDFFASHKSIAKRLQLLCDVGLDYLQLGQPSTTLSGGEAQRIKLVNELAKRGIHTLYILDEPTTGLHNSDIEKLLAVFNRLVDKGNSVMVIEHNLDVLKTVDYLIDLGPEGGDGGGTIVAQGKPQEIVQSKKSYTGQYLKKFLANK